MEDMHTTSRETRVPWLQEEFIVANGFNLVYTTTKLDGIVAKLPGRRSVPITELMRDYSVQMPHSIRKN